MSFEDSDDDDGIVIEEIEGVAGDEDSDDGIEIEEIDVAEATAATVTADSDDDSDDDDLGDAPTVEFVDAPSTTSSQNGTRLKGGFFVAKPKKNKEAPLSAQDLADLRTKRKDEGNAAFQKKRFKDAIAAYTEAIEDLDGAYEAKLYGNRCQAYLELGEWTKAVADAREAVALDPTSEKAAYRLALALLRAGDADEAAGICEKHDSDEGGFGVSSHMAAFRALARDARRAKRKNAQKSRIQRELRELCEEMTPEERRWKAWWAGRGHPQVVDNSNLERFVPDAKSLDVSYDPKVSRELRGPDNLPRLEDPDESDDDDELLEDILDRVGAKELTTLMEDAGCGPRSLLTCARLAPLRAHLEQNFFCQQDDGASSLAALVALARAQAAECLRLAWRGDAALKFPEGEAVAAKPGIGAYYADVAWRQRVRELEVRVLLPPFATGRDVRVELSPRRLRVTIRRPSGFWPYEKNAWAAISDEIGPQLPPDEASASSLPVDDDDDAVLDEVDEVAVPVVETPSVPCSAVDAFARAKQQQQQVPEDDDDDEEPEVEILEEDDDDDELEVEILEDDDDDDEERRVEKHKEEPVSSKNAVVPSAPTPRRLEPRRFAVRWEERGVQIKSFEVSAVPAVDAVKAAIAAAAGPPASRQALTVDDGKAATDAALETASLVTVAEENLNGQVDDEGEVLPASRPPSSELVLLDHALSRKILVDESIWHVSTPDALKGQALQAPVLVVQLHKFQDIRRGTARHAGEMWWRTLFVDYPDELARSSKPDWPDKPPTVFYSLK